MIWQRKSQFGTRTSTIEAPPGEIEPRYDVIVVGGGTNGLACAAFAAKASKSVLLLEAKSALGGACQTGLLGTDLTTSRASHLVRHLDSKMVSKLGLHRLGFRYAERELPTVALGEDGRHISFGKAPWIAGGSLVDFSEKDAESYIVLYRELKSIAKAIELEARTNRTKQNEQNQSTLWPMAPQTLSSKHRALFEELAVSSIGHFLAERFETPLLQGALSFDAVLGRNISPYWPGSALNLPMAWSGKVKGRLGAIGMPRGGMGAITEALTRSLLKHGGTFRTDREVTRLLAQDGHIKAVEIGGGAQIEAGQVVCAFAGAERLISSLDSAGESNSARFNIQAQPKGSVAKLNLELDGLPSLKGRSSETLDSARYIIAPSLEVIEEAFVPSKYGRYSSEPIMEVLFPTLATPLNEGQTRHAASINVQFAPYDLKGGWEGEKDNFISGCAKTLSKYFPDFASRIVGGELLAPPDLEREFGLSEGHWHFHRPTIQTFGSFERDQSEGMAGRLVDGLYFCGSDRTPGAGVRGTSGRIAAETLLSDKAFRGKK